MHRRKAETSFIGSGRIKNIPAKDLHRILKRTVRHSISSYFGAGQHLEAVTDDPARRVHHAGDPGGKRVIERLPRGTITDT